MRNWNELFVGQIPPARIFTDMITRLGLATDASFYRLVPEVVIRPQDEREVAAILRICREQKVGATFRAAGTSLSGQSVGNGVLVDIMHHWHGLEILDLKLKRNGAGYFLNIKYSIF